MNKDFLSKHVPLTIRFGLPLILYSAAVIYFLRWDMTSEELAELVNTPVIEILAFLGLAMALFPWGLLGLFGSSPADIQLTAVAGHFFYLIMLVAFGFARRVSSFSLVLLLFLVMLMLNVRGCSEMLPIGL